MRSLSGVGGVLLLGLVACNDSPQDTTLDQGLPPDASRIDRGFEAASPEAAPSVDMTGTIDGAEPACSSAGWPDLPDGGLLATDPNIAIPDKCVLVPGGTQYEDTIPDTLDLAERAKFFIQGMTRSLMKQYFYAPAGEIRYFSKQPQLVYKGGTPNWGKPSQALIMARRMSGYDLDDAEGTLSIQLASLRNMIDANVNLNFLQNGESAWIVTPGPPEGITAMSVAVEALIELYRQKPYPALRGLIQEMIDYHTVAAKSLSQNGLSMLYYFNPPNDDPVVTNNFNSTVGNFGYYIQPFMNGKAMRALATWSLLASDAQASATADQLGLFVLNYNASQFWDPSLIPGAAADGIGGGTGHYAGHDHGFLNAIMGVLWEAEQLRQTSPQDPRVAAYIDFALQAYRFVRDVHGLGVLGNFGEICTVGDMLRLATKLTDLGAQDLYDDVHRYVVNQLAANQILANSAYIADLPDANDLYDHIGSRVRGLFFEDASHPFAIPFDPSRPRSETDVVNNNFKSVACGFGNPMMGMYAAWEHIVQFKGSFAQINLPLNRASPYLDIKSELPYRGRITIRTKADLGPITTLGVRIPNWAEMDKVQVWLDDQELGASQWSRITGTAYLQIPNVKPSSTYAVSFPIVIRTMTITQIRGQDQQWHECNVAGTAQPFVVTTYQGVFRGDTLVDVDHRPPGGIPLYQRQDLAALPPYDVLAPTRTITRFALDTE